MEYLATVEKQTISTRLLLYSRHPYLPVPPFCPRAKLPMALHRTPTNAQSASTRIRQRETPRSGLESRNRLQKRRHQLHLPPIRHLPLPLRSLRSNRPLLKLTQTPTQPCHHQQDHIRHITPTATTPLPHTLLYPTHQWPTPLQMVRRTVPLPQRLHNNTHMLHTLRQCRQIRRLSPRSRNHNSPRRTTRITLHRHMLLRIRAILALRGLTMRGTPLSLSRRVISRLRRPQLPPLRRRRRLRRRLLQAPVRRTLRVSVAKKSSCQQCLLAD